VAEIAVELNAAIIAVTNKTPRVLTVALPESPLGRPALPSGPFQPSRDRTIELGVRRWVREQSALELGYVEQLYTFGDRFRDPRESAGGPRMLSIGYLALVRAPRIEIAHDAAWRDWYDFFPWEDWRAGRPRQLDREIRPLLRRWVASAEASAERSRRRERVEMGFGFSSRTWNRDAVLERYELLYSARLIREALDAGEQRHERQLGMPMALDHRRILATAMGRLRGKITYRPVIFELLPPRFTLTQLQRLAEAIAGVRLHAGNFRRLVESEGLVEPAGGLTAGTRGRPARKYRFRHEVLLERPSPGVRVAR
jgi:hypothetical protein